MPAQDNDGELANAANLLGVATDFGALVLFLMWNILIRTHHITSRKKIAKLKQAADINALYVLVRVGGSPGIMYGEGSKDGVKAWASIVQKLRYKDYQLASRPALVESENTTAPGVRAFGSGLHETESVKDFGLQMQQRGVFAWWRKAMGFISEA